MAKGKYQQWLTDEGLTRLKGWARDGLTDEQIARNMGITTSTLYDWKNKYSDISESLKNNKDVADYEVENALFKKAVGFVGDDDRYYPPDATAAIFWLKNRKPEVWRDKRDVALDSSVPIIITDDVKE